MMNAWSWALIASFLIKLIKQFKQKCSIIRRSLLELNYSKEEFCNLSFCRYFLKQWTPNKLTCQHSGESLWHFHTFKKREIGIIQLKNHIYSFLLQKTHVLFKFKAIFKSVSCYQIIKLLSCMLHLWLSSDWT